MSTYKYKLPPASPHEEEAILGGAIQHPEIFHEAAKLLGEYAAEIWHEPRHKKAWLWLEGWYAKHPCIKPGRASIHAIEEGLGDLLHMGCTPSYTEYYVKELLRYWAFRKTRDDAATLARCCDAQKKEDLLETFSNIKKTLQAAYLLEE